MCKIGGGSVSKILDPLGLFEKPAAVEMPAAEIPAAPAPTRKQDTGAIVKLGDVSLDNRLGGGGTGTSNRRAGSSLGNLGRGGLSI